MTVAFSYFRYKINKESHKSFTYYFPGLADVSIIWDKAPEAEGDMGNAARGPAKTPTVAENGHTSQEEHIETLHVASLEMKEKPRFPFWRAIYVILSAITIFLCIAVIAVSVSTAIATKSFSVHHSGRVVVMIILAVTAAITLTMVIYAMMGVIRKHKKPIHVAAGVFFIMAIIQTLICVISVDWTTEDEINLNKALVDSFRMSMEENPRHVKLWTMTQSDLTCCGIYGAGDYKTPNIPLYFPPDVPISCCSSYDPDRSELVQERERESCKARREYYDVGCREPVLELFRYTATMVLSVTVVLILFEILLSILSYVVTKSKKCNQNCDDVLEQRIENPKAKL